MDWGDLGPPAGWPPRLAALTDVLLASRRPMWLAWGDGLTLVANDASGLAAASGRPAPEALGDAWAAVRADVEAVLGGGAPLADAARELLPLHDEGGGVGGVLWASGGDARWQELERSWALADRAQRVARISSYELDLSTGAIEASAEFMRQLALSREELAANGLQAAFEQRVHPDDLGSVQAALEHAVASRSPTVTYLARIVTPDGAERLYRTIGELEYGADGAPLMRGSNQDVTEQVEAERQKAVAAAELEATTRERAIADELQRSLLPADATGAGGLDIASFYGAGAEGTQVGGDWYDVIDIGAGRVALVLGDVMGRGVRAAAVMGQLRAAVRAYAQLDLSPPDVLESLDAVLRDLDSGHIATCVYAVHDANEQTLAYANAGHLPPLWLAPGAAPRRLDGALGPPLGSGPAELHGEVLDLPEDSLVVLYSDGLVERRDRPIDVGVDQLAARLPGTPAAVAEIPGALVEALVPEGADDDVAVLVARVLPRRHAVGVELVLDSEPSELPRARARTTEVLADAPERLREDAALLVSEMATNAILHGRPPILLRVRRVDEGVLLEVEDQATAIPRKRRPGPDDEHGRGLLLVNAISARWGVRPTPHGKAVWCVLAV